MKKTIMFLGVLSLGLVQAQQEFEGKVGMNTDQPNATLNVKSKTGNVGGKNLELQNDSGKQLVTVLDNGNVGIGTDEPNANLHLIADNNKGITQLAEFRNLNTSSSNRLTINTGSSTSSDRNTLGLALMGKGYVDNTDQSLSGNNAVIYSTTPNGLNLQVHKKDAKFKFYTGVVGEGAVTMSILPYNVRINADDTTPSKSVLTIGSHTSTNTSNKLGLMSTNEVGTNLITYYNVTGEWDAQIGIDHSNKDQFQVKIFNPEKHFGVYLNNSTRFTINNSGFARVGRQTGITPSMLTVDGSLTEDGEQIGLRLQASQNTSTYATIYFDKAETGGMRFKTTHNKHNYQFDTSKVVSALRIQTEGNVGIGTSDPTEKLEVAGAIKLANSSDNTCDGTKAGTIRFVNKKFQGCTGTEWKDLHN